MPETASFAGAGIQFKETWGLPEQAMFGRPSQSMLSVASSFFRQGALAPTITDSKGPVITNGRTPSLRCLREPANSCGGFSSFITTCGTTTLQRSQYLALCAAAASRYLWSFRETRQGTFLS